MYIVSVRISGIFMPGQQTHQIFVGCTGEAINTHFNHTWASTGLNYFPCTFVQWNKQRSGDNSVTCS